ncbi:hypothetical protein LAJ19_20250 (plasmid) [Deinococcus taeanensis]|uniref:DUF7587 domain-containing protein n=1 Tax=Deinococcus taeanensis TaxID=2737050 RepID=UPI001CDC5D08|nr:hypothetical protein [Deinococcus taeanensis]UBV45460.1 hypothetical protein LAJ19_20250 [Deinococcus taeanensis]
MINNNSQNIVYRVIKPEENPAKGLFAPFQDSARNRTGHVLDGSREEYLQSWISATRDYNVALQWAEKSGNRIVAIDLSKVTATVVDVSTPEGRAKYLRGVTANNRASASVEILIDRTVPANAIMFMTEVCK